MVRASRIVAWIVACGVTAACASPRTLTDVDRRSLEGAMLVGVAGKEARLNFESAGGTAAAVFLGPAGAAASAPGARERGAQQGIQDPASAIRDALAERLQQSLSMRYVGVQEHPPADSGYALHVETLLWRVFYLPLSGGKYGLQYQADMTLVDLASNQALARGECFFSPIYGASAPTYDELVANDASRLKLEFSKAVTQCVEEMSQKLTPSGTP